MAHHRIGEPDARAMAQIADPRRPAVVGEGLEGLPRQIEELR